MSLVRYIDYLRFSSINKSALETAFRESQCEKIFAEHQTGKDTERAQLNDMLLFVRIGDTVVVTKLDRLARSTKSLLQIADTISSKGVSLEVLNIKLDTSTPTGKLMLTMLGAISEFEREIMLERQKEGIAIARKNGTYKGCKPVDAKKLISARKLIDSRYSIASAAREAGVSRRTYYTAQADERV